MMRYYYPGITGYGYPGMMGYGYDFSYSIMHLIGGLLTFLFWLIIIILVIRLIRRRGLMGDRRHIWMHQSALDILKERYAKGEINKEEFEQKRKDLEA